MKSLSLTPIQAPAGRPTAFDSGRMLPFAALLTAALLWGGSFAAMRVAVQAMSPWSVMWLRMAIALIVILPFAGRLELHRYRRGDWRLLVPMVLFQPCIYFLLESYALKLTTSSQAGVISASVPLMVAVGGWCFLSEPLGKRILGGLFLSVMGVVVLSLCGDVSGSAVNPLLGNALELGAMSSAAVNILLVKRLCDRYNPWLLTAFQVLAGTLFFSPGLFFLFNGKAVAWTPSLVLGILFLGGLVTLGAFGLYNWAMSRIPASRAAMFINMVPVTAVAFGWVMLAESLSMVQCIAAVAVIAGVAVSQKGP